ncbi:hypothetical protein AMQ83_03710 [Paenibacillus riograndensis]|nr:hypothetical protein AMQ83_03710 [Paenibacillus riograndensis]
MRGKNCLYLVISGWLGEMRGKNTFDLVRNGWLGEMRGKNTFDLVRNGRLRANEFPFFHFELPKDSYRVLEANAT